MYRTLLVPLDGSVFGERALPLAMTLAWRVGAQLVLMRAANAAVFPGVDATNAEVQAVEEARAYLVNLKAECSGQGAGIDIAVPYGDPAGEILQEIETRHVDLVVMSTHGRSGLGRWIYGSVGEKVLAASPVPVLLVRPTGHAPALDRDLAHSSIVVPLDGSALAEAALPHAEYLAQRLGGKLVLLRVVEPPGPAFAFPGTVASPPPHVEPDREAELYLAVRGERISATGIPVQTAVRAGWAADVIAYGCTEWQPGMIVMATHGRAGVARALLGSVALEVVRRSPLPVLLIRPTELAQAQG
jgi:nucleotide-binding universal stress UspA family protein